MHIPRKRFGQHFLCDQAVIQGIVSALSPKVGEHLIEIGPGQGALTLPVLKRVHDLEVIELDRDLIPELQERTRHVGTLHVHSADVLAFNFSDIKHDDRLLRVFGNLPYNISTPLIFHLILYADIIEDMVFMVQKEVAERLAAETDADHYGRLSVMAQYHWHIESLFDVPPDAFYPPPRVDSSIIRMVPRGEDKPHALDYALFERIVKSAFSQRRKTLRNSLKNEVNDEMWERISIRSTLRAEALSVSDFVELSNLILDMKNHGDLCNR